MALTISGHPPGNIINDPSFTAVTTSLVEGASYQNLRIRATVWIGGRETPAAILEQPKGLDAWDFYELLRTFTGKCDTPLGGSDMWTTPELSSQLITSWTNFGGSFGTFTSSGRQITSVISSGAAVANTNDLGSDVPGDVYVVGLENDFTDSGAEDFRLRLQTTGIGTVQSATEYAGFTFGQKLDNNHIYFLMSQETVSTPAIVLATAGASAGDGTFSCRKITDFRNNPGVYFHIKFEEVYENASDVTTIGAESWADTMLFIPAILRPGESWYTDYYGSGAKFLSRVEEGAARFKLGMGMENRIMYVDTGVISEVTLTPDSGAQDDFYNNAGWAMIILNDNMVGIDAQDESIDIKADSVESSGTLIHTIAEATIECETRCYPNMKAISFVGDLGDETVLFRGLTTKTGGSEKTYYKNQQRIRKVLRGYKKFFQVLRSLYENEATYALIHELLYTDKEVWMINEDADDGYTEVTVISDEAPIIDEDNLFTSEVEIEFYE